MNKYSHYFKTYVPKSEDYLSRMKIIHKAKRIIIEDVAITRIGKLYAVLSTIKRLVIVNTKRLITQTIERSK